MDLKVPYSVAKTAPEAYELAKAQITEDYIAKFNVKAEIDYNPGNFQITAKGKGFSLGLQFRDDATEVSCELGFLLKAFKGKVLETIEHKLAKHV